MQVGSGARAALQIEERNGRPGAGHERSETSGRERHSTAREIGKEGRDRQEVGADNIVRGSRSGGAALQRGGGEEGGARSGRAFRWEVFELQRLPARAGHHRTGVPHKKAGVRGQLAPRVRSWLEVGTEQGQGSHTYGRSVSLTRSPPCAYDEVPRARAMMRDPSRCAR